MASKRENGAGSVYKRSDAKYRPWVAVAPAGSILAEIRRQAPGA